MQIVIVSDTHSQNEILECLEKKYKDAYAYIHCGDLEDDPRFYPNWLIVKGNNDYYGKFREDFRIRVGSHRIYVTHSHRCSYLYREQNLVRLAKEYGCDIVCYGHTHVSKIKTGRRCSFNQSRFSQTAKGWQITKLCLVRD